MFQKKTPPSAPAAVPSAPPAAPQPAQPMDSSGADAARANHAKRAGAEDNPGSHAKQLHDQGKAHGAKHGA